jgi:hypothetical protein
VARSSSSLDVGSWCEVVFNGDPNTQGFRAATLRLLRPAAAAATAPDLVLRYTRTRADLLTFGAHDARCAFSVARLVNGRAAPRFGCALRVGVAWANVMSVTAWSLPALDVQPP